MVLKTQSLVFKWEAPCFRAQKPERRLETGLWCRSQFSLVLQTTALLPAGLSPGDFHTRNIGNLKCPTPNVPISEQL